MRDTIHIACTPDNNYAQHCVVMLNSLFINNPGESFCIHIVQNGLNEENKRILERFIIHKKTLYKFYTIDGHQLSDAPVTLHISVAAYYRILLPPLLDKAIGKILYLDADLVIRTPIRPLWEIDISSYYIGASNDMMPISHFEKIMLDKNAGYFNSGVMLINLKKWADDDIVNKCVALIKNQPERIIYWDQDVLNIMFENRWKNIGYYWNVNHFFYLSAYNCQSFAISEEEYSGLKKSPGILHFSGHLKPWTYNNTHPLKNEYYKYLKDTPWSSFRGFGAPTRMQEFKHKVKAVLKNFWVI
jgi:lipopolysaccharide biosynthesis glycosyltransferase